MCAFVEGRSKSNNGLVRNRTLNLKRKKVNASNYESLLDCTKTYFSRAGFYRHFYMRRISDSKKRMLANEDCDSYATNRLPCALYLCFLQYMLTCLRNKIRMEQKFLDSWKVFILYLYNIHTIYIP